MLDRLQRQLADIYQTGNCADVRQFLVTDPALAHQLSNGRMQTGTDETLLLAEGEDELSVSLFLDKDLLRRLENADPLQRLHPHQLADLWTVLEGVSHFLCVAWKAERDRPVSLLELELQGEVDKFVASTLLAMDQQSTGLAQGIHRRLFEDFRFRTDLSDEQHERYRTANDFAARFCYRLRKRLQVRRADVFPELRQFYRLPLAEKLSHIRAAAF